MTDKFPVCTCVRARRKMGSDIACGFPENTLVVQHTHAHTHTRLQIKQLNISTHAHTHTHMRTAKPMGNTANTTNDTHTHTRTYRWRERESQHEWGICHKTGKKLWDISVYTETMKTHTYIHTHTLGCMSVCLHVSVCVL